MSEVPATKFFMILPLPFPITTYLKYLDRTLRHHGIPHIRFQCSTEHLKNDPWTRKPVHSAIRGENMFQTSKQVLGVKQKALSSLFYSLELSCTKVLVLSSSPSISWEIALSSSDWLGAPNNINYPWLLVGETGRDTPTASSLDPSQEESDFYFYGVTD